MADVRVSRGRGPAREARRRDDAGRALLRDRELEQRRRRVAVGLRGTAVVGLRHAADRIAARRVAERARVRVHADDAVADPDAGHHRRHGRGAVGRLRVERPGPHPRDRRHAVHRERAVVAKAHQARGGRRDGAEAVADQHDDVARRRRRGGRRRRGRRDRRQQREADDARCACGDVRCASGVARRDPDDARHEPVDHHVLRDVAHSPIASRISANSCVLSIVPWKRAAFAPAADSITSPPPIVDGSSTAAS